MQPYAVVGMAAEHMFGFFRIVQITEHNGRAGNADFAFLAGIDFFCGADLHNFIICVRERNADGTVSCIVDGCQAACRHAFGGSVAFSDLNLCTVRGQEFIDSVF